MCPVLTGKGPGSSSGGSSSGHESLPELGMLSLDGQPLRTRVLESRHGKILTVSILLFTEIEDMNIYGNVENRICEEFFSNNLSLKIVIEIERNFQ